MTTPVIALVLLSGAACSSPVEQAAHQTVAWQVPCAIVIRQQSANPFKLAQTQNTVTQAKAKPAFKYPPKKKPKKKTRKKRR